MECDITSKTSLLFSRLRCLKSNRTEIKPGSICDEQFELLVELSPVYSKKSIKAMRDYLVLGKKKGGLRTAQREQWLSKHKSWKDLLYS